MFAQGTVILFTGSKVIQDTSYLMNLLEKFIDGIRDKYSVSKRYAVLVKQAHRTI